MPERRHARGGAITDDPQPGDNPSVQARSGHRHLLGHIVVTLLLVAALVALAIWLSSTPRPRSREQAGQPGRALAFTELANV